MRELLVVFAIAWLPLVPSTSAGQEPEFGAKALFYNASGAIESVPSKTEEPPKTAAAQPTRKPAPTLALRASVLLASADGGTREVRPSHPFRTGDRIKLAFTANRTGYFYLATLGSSGKVQILAPRRGEPAILEAGYRYQYPAAQSAYFRFDGQAGKETLWAVLADEPLQAISLGDGRVAQIPQAEGGSVPASAVASVSDELAGKDLIFEEDAEAAYASVRPSADRRAALGAKPKVMVRLVLDHN